MNLINRKTRRTKRPHKHRKYHEKAKSLTNVLEKLELENVKARNARCVAMPLETNIFTRVSSLVDHRTYRPTVIRMDS